MEIVKPEELRGPAGFRFFVAFNRSSHQLADSCERAPAERGQLL